MVVAAVRGTEEAQPRVAADQPENHVTARVEIVNGNQQLTVAGLREVLAEELGMAASEIGGIRSREARGGRE